MKTPEEVPEAHQTARPWLPKFGIAEMMLAMMIFCVMAAAGNYLWAAIRSNQGHQGRAVFVIFTLASPVALVLALSGYLALKRWLADR